MKTSLVKILCIKAKLYAILCILFVMKTCLKGSVRETETENLKLKPATYEN